MDMEPPKHDGSAWTGSAENIRLQWKQTVGMVVLAWAAFLRCSELINLQVCDMTWVAQRMELCIRKAKADQLGLTAVTELEYAREGSEKCLLSWFEGYLTEVLGGVDVKVEYQGGSQILRVSSMWVGVPEHLLGWGLGAAEQRYVNTATIQAGFQAVGRSGCGSGR